MQYFVLIMLAVMGWWVGPILLFLRQKRRRLKKRLKWTVTEGNVTYAKIKHYKEEAGGDNAKPEEWTVCIEFSYGAAGKMYVASQDWSQNVQPYSYNLGSDVNVYYNPSRPKEAVVNLDEIDPWWIGGWLLAAAFVLPILLFILLVSFKLLTHELFSFFFRLP